MGRFARYDDDAGNTVDLYTVDADFDDAEAGAGWDDRMIYAINETAAAWRSQISVETLDAGY